MMNFSKDVRKALCRLLALGTALAATACNGIIYEEEGDCTPHYFVQFRYDLNLKYANAFAQEVKSVHLYVFDSEEKFVKQFTASGEPLSTGSYQMPVELAPGRYHLVTWGGVEGHPAFTLPALQAGVSTLHDLQCTLKRETQADGTGRVQQDLDIPGGLFHAFAEDVDFPQEPGTHLIPVGLTKNTRRVRVVLQHLSGEAVDVEDFSFSIEGADNGRMAYNNALLPDQALLYLPWHTSNGSAQAQTSAGAQALQVAVAEFSLGRWVKDVTRPQLVVRNGRGETVLSVPLIDYALLVKGYERAGMTDQEYLDRQDEYNLTFFLDDRGRWDEVHILINSWALVLNNTVLQ